MCNINGSFPNAVLGLRTAQVSGFVLVGYALPGTVESWEHYRYLWGHERLVSSGGASDHGVSKLNRAIALL
jgi:hypothetical protein